jgi:hypothetical protein
MDRLARNLDDLRRIVPFAYTVIDAPPIGPYCYAIGNTARFSRYRAGDGALLHIR